MRKIKLLIGFMSIAILSLLAHNWTKPVAGHGAVIHSPAAPATCADIVSFEFEGRTIELDQCYTHTFTYGGTTKSIYIHYTLTNGQASDRLRAVDSNGDGSTDLPPADLVTQLAQWTEEAWRTYRDYGFNDPLGRSDMNINLFDDNPLGWCCTGDSYSYDAPHLMWSLSNVGDPKDGATVAFHEMWHASQY